MRASSPRSNAGRLNKGKARAKARPLTQRIAQSPLLLRKFLRSLDREKKHLLSELVQVKGLMPLLMKPRNRMHWSKRDKHELTKHLQRLQHLAPYIAVFLLPGGMAMLPILAWWLDRRRGQRIMRAAWQKKAPLSGAFRK